jgi:threonine/homoserine/homoserine lactone efflux protein
VQIGWFGMNFLQFAITHLFGVLTPGPGFILVFENAAIFGRRSGIISSIGLNIAYIIHISVIVFFNKNNIEVNKFLLLGLNIFSILYFFYLAYRSFKNESIKKFLHFESAGSGVANVDVRFGLKILLEAFLIGFFNTKGVLMFGFLLNHFAHSGNIVYYGIWIPFALTIYHNIMIYCVTRESVRVKFIKNIRFANKVFSVLLLLFGLRMVKKCFDFIF